MSEGPEEMAALRVCLEPEGLPVSYLSSMLRVFQAALRETARSDEATRPAFEGRPQPLLQVVRVSLDRCLVLHMAFVDPLSAQPMPQVSARAFREFLGRFSRFLMSMPQPGLWGRSLRGPTRRQPEDALERRMDRLRIELRHFRRVTLAYGERAIAVEGDRVEIS